MITISCIPLSILFSLRLLLRSRHLKKSRQTFNPLFIEIDEPWFRARSGQLKLSILFSLRLKVRQKLSNDRINFQSSFHWDDWKWRRYKHIVGWLSILFSLRSILMINTVTANQMFFQSSFHWDNNKQKIYKTETENFQSSFHWDVAFFLLKIIIGSRLSILFSLRLALSGQQNGRLKNAFNPLFIEINPML